MKKLMVLVAVLGVPSMGCMSSVPVQPATPDNQPALTTCQNLANEHNDFVFGDIVVGGLSGVAAGLVAGFAPSNPGLAQGFAAGAAVGGGLVAVGAALVGLTASEYQSAQCDQYVGPLPLAMKTVTPAPASK